MPQPQNALLVVPRFNGRSFWNFLDACQLFGAKTPGAPLGLITVAALLPKSWECRLVNLNTEELTDADLAWADMVMTGGMLPQRPDTLRLIDFVKQKGKPVIVGGPDVTSAPEAYANADCRVLGEAEGIIDEFISAWDSGTRQGVFEAPKFTIDVTKTPIPRYDLLKREQYLYLGVQFSRGCPFTCEFCDIIELYGRVPRTKTKDQMLAELDALYNIGYRGHLDFVDDNFIGNKKAVKAFLPHLIAWQKAHGYPYELSTEASVNLADDSALLALMREANFFTIFVGIESPDTDTLVAMQKKQNTRRSLPQSIYKIYDAGIYVNAGFILGFDTEKGSVADGMIKLIEDAAIPVCTVGLLYGLPTTQLTRRLAHEGRLFPDLYTDKQVSEGVGDHCTAGLNFTTKRPRRDILVDYRKVLKNVYSPSAYFGRVRRMALALNRPDLVPDHVDPNAKQPMHIGPVAVSDLGLLWRLVKRIARQPKALWHFALVFVACARRNPKALEYVGVTAAMYLHLGPFSRFVIAGLDRQIQQIDAGEWLSPLREVAGTVSATPIHAGARDEPQRATARAAVG
jgi:radical SAM superfamily enzyme YgiQ (UPF0313 family)